MRKIEIIRCKNNSKEKFKDLIINEAYLDLWVNNTFLTSIAYTPGNEKELVYGYLFLNNFISRKKDVKSLILEKIDSEHKICRAETVRNSRKSYYKKERIELDCDEILSLMKKTLLKATIFEKTGGAHISSLSDGKGIISYFEDVSRTVTILKIAGDFLMRNLQPYIFLTSARINDRIVNYVKKLDVKIIVSHSAPTDLAIKKASEFNILLVGFARDNRFNIYNDFLLKQERI
jgi:FdhD protein